MGVVRDSRNFKTPMYWAHRAVIFAIAQLSCICRPNQRDFVDKIIVVSLFSNVGYRLPEVRGSE